MNRMLQTLKKCQYSMLQEAHKTFFHITLLDICARVLDPFSAKLYDCGFLDSANIRSWDGYTAERSLSNISVLAL